MGYSIDPMADNCYPGTAILINKFDIRDEAKLNEVETVLVSARSAEWITAPAANTFDFAHNEFVEELTDFYCSTNYLHPFREGNGRTQRVFLTQLVRNAGYDLNWSEVDGELLMIATIQSAQGVTDLLRQVLGKSIK